MAKDIMSFYPYPEPRLGHEDTLRTIQKEWNSFDVCLVVAPVAAGKTVLRQAVARFAGDSTMLVPTNQLMEQEIKEFPDTRSLFAIKHYPTTEHHKRAVADSRKRGVPILCVPHMYLARGLRRQALLVDEGHRLVEFNKELMAKHLWREDVGIPSTVKSREEIKRWLLGHRDLPHSEKLLAMVDDSGYFLTRSKEPCRGKMKDRISFVPMQPDLSPAIGNGVRKIFLFSATLSDVDLRDLGIQNDKKVLRLELPSVISPDRRPLIRRYVGTICRQNQEGMIVSIIAETKKLLREHPGKKGLVHVTYEMLRQIRERVGDDPRFLFHTNAVDAKTVLRQWRSSARSNVLFAAGFDEGLDLKGERFAWQGIAKIVWPSLGDIAVAARAASDPKWYVWQALRKTIQMYGRICRGPEDFGATYVFDQGFERLVREGINYGLIPEFFMEALVKF